MTILYLNGVAMPAPTTYDVSLADIHAANSGRSDSGIMTIDVVRKDVATLNLAWEYLTTEELETITTNIDSAEIQTRFFYGTFKEAVTYKGDRQVNLQFIDENGEARWEISFKLIEY